MSSPLSEVSLSLIPIVGGAIGVFLNSILAWLILVRRPAVARSKSAGLLGCLALSDALSSLAMLVSGVYTLSFSLLHLRHTLHSCLIFYALPTLAALTTSAVFILAVSVDRYFLTRFPVPHRLMNAKKYVGMWIAVAIGGVLAFTGIALASTKERIHGRQCDYTTPFVNEFPRSILGPVHAILCVCILVFNRLALSVKPAVGEAEATGELRKKFNRCVRAIVFIYIASWVFSGLLRFAVRMSCHQGSLLLVSQLLLQAGVAVNLGSNFFVLYNFTSDYRAAIRDLLGMPTITSALLPIFHITVYPAALARHPSLPQTPSSPKDITILTPLGST